jgi:hypothetical protein
MVRDRGATTMSHEPSMPPSKTLEDHARELTTALRGGYEAWSRAKNPNNEEMWIVTDVFLKGIFDFVVPTLVQTLGLNERGAQTITQRFAQHLNEAVRRASFPNYRPITEDEDEDDEDIDTLMPPLGEEEARLYRELPPNLEFEDEEEDF